MRGSILSGRGEADRESFGAFFPLSYRYGEEEGGGGVAYYGMILIIAIDWYVCSHHPSVIPSMGIPVDCLENHPVAVNDDQRHSHHRRKGVVGDCMGLFVVVGAEERASLRGGECYLD